MAKKYSYIILYYGSRMINGIMFGPKQLYIWYLNINILLKVFFLNYPNPDSYHDHDTSFKLFKLYMSQGDWKILVGTPRSCLVPKTQLFSKWWQSLLL